MKKIALFAASAALLSSTVITSVQANPGGLDERQQLIQSKMEILADAQSMMQLEIQAHFKRAQSIQSYQMCIQAASKKDDIRICKMQLKKDNKMLDDEIASLRKDVKM